MRRGTRDMGQNKNVRFLSAYLLAGDVRLESTIAAATSGLRLRFWIGRVVLCRGHRRVQFEGGSRKLARATAEFDGGGRFEDAHFGLRMHVPGAGVFSERVEHKTRGIRLTFGRRCAIFIERAYCSAHSAGGQRFLRLRTTVGLAQRIRRAHGRGRERGRGGDEYISSKSRRLSEDRRRCE